MIYDFGQVFTDGEIEEILSFKPELRGIAVSLNTEALPSVGAITIRELREILAQARKAKASVSYILGEK